MTKEGAPNELLEKLRFEPAAGTVIREAPGAGYGYWAGGMRPSFDPVSQKFYLFYRLRTPLEQGRGAECYVAESDDGVLFHDVWHATKQSLCASSIEVGHLVRAPTGEWRLYLSYEYALGGFWRIDVLRGPDPTRLDTQGRRTVIGPHDFGLEFVKDPVVYLRDGRYWLYACGTPRQRFSRDELGVRTAGREATLLFQSDDGLHFDRARYVFEPTGSGWDGFTSRLGCVFEFGPAYAAFYDGGRSIFDMYEESTGLATSPDGLQFHRISIDGPWLVSPHGSVRYAHGLRVGDALYVYYEYTREDLSHDMRVVRLSLA